MKTEHFVKQHNEMVGIVQEISKLLNEKDLKDDPSKVGQLLSQLAGKLANHLAMEDRTLYPNLLKSEDPNVVAIAQRYVQEMGTIAEVFKNYVAKWRGNSQKQENPEDFIRESNDLFAALGKRIEKENKELYPLLEKC